MKPPAPTRRDRLRAMLADLRMPGALEAVDGILSELGTLVLSGRSNGEDADDANELVAEDRQCCPH